MESNEFARIKERFVKGSTREKTELYVKAEGLNKDQYKELLKSFPLEELDKLEEALEYS